MFSAADRAIETRRYQDLLIEFNIPMEHHEHFAEFVETGEAPDEFLAYFDGNEDCQRAVEQAFALRVEALREAVHALQAEGATA